MTRKNNRDLTHWIVMLAVGAAVYLIGCHLARAGAAEAPPVDTGWNWQTWLLLATSVLTGASIVLHIVAPRTKATWDDKLRDDIDEVLAFARGSTLPGKPSQPAVAPARDPQAGVSFLGCMVALSIGGLIALALAASGCTAAQRTQVASEAKTALINCTAQDLGAAPHLDLATLVAVVNLAAVERAKCSTTGSLDWQCVKKDLVSQGAVLGGCTLVAMITAAAGAFTSPSDRLSAATPVLPGRAEFLEFRVSVGGGATYHTGAGDF